MDGPSELDMITYAATKEAAGRCFCRVCAVCLQRMKDRDEAMSSNRVAVRRNANHSTRVAFYGDRYNEETIFDYGCKVNNPDKNYRCPCGAEYDKFADIVSRSRFFDPALPTEIIITPRIF